MATIDYKVDYEDERFQQVDEQHQQRVDDVESTYAGIMGNTDKYYDDLINANKEWEATQSQLQQDRTENTIQQIEQQKEQSRKDYLKEQSASYVDWRKQSNQYGTEAEKMASSGLMNTGYSESSQVSMYNTYQNRVAVARESFERATVDYNNAINEAVLQNNSALAEIAYKAYQERLTLALEGFQYKNNLVLQLADKKLQLEQMRDNNWYKVLDQINTENALAEDVRQFDENIKFQTTQAELDRNFQAKQAEINRQYEAQQAALERQHDFDLLKAKTEEERKLADEAHLRQLDLLAQQHKNDLAILEKQYEISKRGSSTTISKGSGSSSSSSSSSSKGSSSTVKKTSSSSSSSTKKAVNMDSVLALGQGPISASNLASQVASGKVKATTTNGKTTFSYNYTSANPLNKAGSALILDAPWKKTK